MVPFEGSAAARAPLLPGISRIGTGYVDDGVDDDSRPCMRLWDLRRTPRPMFELAAAQGRDGHSRGIIDLAWCPHDEAIIASTGKDKRTLFWDLYTCAVVQELDTTEISAAANETQALGNARLDEWIRI